MLFALNHHCNKCILVSCFVTFSNTFTICKIYKTCNGELVNFRFKTSQGIEIERINFIIYGLWMPIFKMLKIQSEFIIDKSNYQQNVRIHTHPSSKIF